MTLLKPLPRDKDAAETHPSLEFLIQHYAHFLRTNESIEVTACSTAELLEQAAEASALRKLLLDYSEEGYTKLTDRLIQQTNALERLQAILNRMVPQLGSATEQELFYLSPEIVPIPAIAQAEFGAGEVFELHEYLHYLQEQTKQPVDIAACFPNPQAMQAWQQKTAISIQEMLDFLAWIVARQKQQPDHVPVPLLRDTLLVHFGLLWLYQAQLIPQAPVPLFLSRKFISALSNSEKTYFTLVSWTLYQILLEQQDCDLATLRQAFIAQSKTQADISPAFVEMSQAYWDSLSLEAPPLIIETGLNGTFPLWILNLNKNQGDFLLYTTAPWLYRTYQDVIFRKNYNYLRDLETIILHDKLFQFEAYADGRVTVQETRNHSIRQLALYELKIFQQRFNEQFLQ